MIIWDGLLDAYETRRNKHLKNENIIKERIDINREEKDKLLNELLIEFTNGWYEEADRFLRKKGIIV